MGFWFRALSKVDQLASILEGDRRVLADEFPFGEPPQNSTSMIEKRVKWALFWKLFGFPAPLLVLRTWAGVFFGFPHTHRTEAGCVVLRVSFLVGSKGGQLENHHGQNMGQVYSSLSNASLFEGTLKWGWFRGTPNSPPPPFFRGPH